MMVTHISPVVKVTHEAFAAAAGNPLVNGQVVGLHVNSDSNTPSMTLDLYPVEGPQISINPNWAMNLTGDELTQLMHETILNQLP